MEGVSDCACARYFARYSCGANVGEGECDCPKCQGFCEECEARKDYAELYRFLRWEALGGEDGGVVSIWFDDFDAENAARMEAAKKNHGSPWNVPD